MVHHQLVAWLALLLALPSSAGADLDAIIIGAGIAGVGAASVLAASGVSNYLVIEATDRIGGRVHAMQFGASHPMTIGPENSPAGAARRSSAAGKRDLEVAGNVLALNLSRYQAPMKLSSAECLKTLRRQRFSPRHGTAHQRRHAPALPAAPAH